MHTAEVEVTFWRHVGDVRCNAPLLAKLPDDCRCIGIIDSGQNHRNGWVVQICRLEFLVHVFHLLLLNPIGYFVVQPIARADKGDFRIGVEEVQNATCCYLSAFAVNVNSLLHDSDNQCCDANSKTYLAATDDQYFLVPDLPREDERASALDFRVFVSHNVVCDGNRQGVIFPGLLVLLLISPITGERAA